MREPDSQTRDGAEHSERGSDPLSVAGLDRDLSRRSVRGGAFVMAGQGGSILVGIASAAVLARLLDPEDFGLVAMAGAFIVLLGEFADLGLSQATVQRREVTTAQVSTLFWVNVGLGAAAMLIGFALSWPIGLFYEDARLGPVAAALSIGFFFSGVAAQPLAVLRRRMRFAAETTVTLISLAVGLLAAIVAALSGLGYWSLVVQTLATAATRMAGMFIASGWMPSRPARAEGIREILRFGGYLSGSNLIAAVIRSIDKILVGRFVGADAAGLYSNAQRILLAPVTQLNKPLTMVARPALARLQDDPERFRAYYRRGIEVVASASLPTIAVAVIMAGDLVRVVLGPGWDGVVPIFMALAPAGLLATLAVITTWVYVPLGRTDRQFRWICLQSIGVVAGMAIGLRYGAVGVAAGYSIAVACLRVPAIAWCLKGTFVRWSDVGSAIWRPLLATAVAAAAILAAGGAIASLEAPSARLAIGALAFAAVYLVSFLALPGGFARASAIVAMVRHLRPNPGNR